MTDRRHPSAIAADLVALRAEGAGVTKLDDLIVELAGWLVGGAVDSLDDPKVTEAVAKFSG